MKTSLLFLCFISTAGFIWQAFSTSKALIPSALFPYLLAEIFFSTACWRLASAVGFNSPLYAQVFFAGMSFVSLTRILLAFEFMRSFPSLGGAAAVMEGAFVFCCLFGLSFAWSASLAKNLNPFSAAHIACATAIFFCGCISLASLAFPGTLVTDVLKFGLGILWLVEGLHAFSAAALYFRARALAVERASFIPSLVASIVFCALALFLYNQREVSRQADMRTVSHVQFLEELHALAFCKGRIS